MRLKIWKYESTPESGGGRAVWAGPKLDFPAKLSHYEHVPVGRTIRPGSRGGGGGEGDGEHL